MPVSVTKKVKGKQSYLSKMYLYSKHNFLLSNNIEKNNGFSSVNKKDISKPTIIPMFNWRLTYVCEITIIYRSAKILLSSSECSYIGCTRMSINVSQCDIDILVQPVYEHSDEPAPGQKTTNWISPRFLPSPRVSTARIRRYSKRNCFTKSH